MGALLKKICHSLTLTQYCTSSAGYKKIQRRRNTWARNGPRSSNTLIYKPLFGNHQAFTVNNISEAKTFFMHVKSRFHHGLMGSCWHTFSANKKMHRGGGSSTGWMDWSHLLVGRNLAFQHIQCFIWSLWKKNYWIYLFKQKLHILFTAADTILRNSIDLNTCHLLPEWF